MIVSPHKTHHLSSPRHPANLSPASSSSPSYNSANRNFFNISQSSATPSPSENSAKLQSYFEPTPSSAPASSVVLDTSNIPITNIDVFMPHSLDFPSNQSSSYPFTLTDAADDLSMWSLGGGNNGVANQIEPLSRRGQNHQRLPSSSSIGSTASATTASPFQGHQAARALRGPDQVAGKQNTSRGYSRNQSARSHLPTPTQTPTRNTFLSPTSPGFGQHSQDMNSTVAASLGLNQALDEELPQMSHSNRVSFSSMQGPATPMTAVNDSHDERQRALNNDSMNNAMVTVSSSLPDLFYSQNLATSQAPSNPNFLMPHGNSMMNERLMEAQMARSQSSGSNQSVPLSPMKYHMSPHTDSEPKTISPKDAVLDYKPSANDFPLFGQTTDMAASYPAVATVPTRQQQYNQPSAIDFNNMSNTQGWNQNLQAMTSAAMPTYPTFATPTLPSNLNMGSIGGGFLGSSRPHPRRTVSRDTDHTPEFPAQLTSMESSASEAAPPSSIASTNVLMSSPKPESSSADTGTYSCTYHGCLQRFSTPQKLQKHKRDVHRNNPHVTPGVGSGMSTAQLMERNSQAGPHKCERINPTTGKSCNAVFSRPYDLTRHEDTIHNARKQKVRCAICTEEKTFSRSDALTRHMRVVHPEVDFPGKHRKRGSRDE